MIFFILVFTALSILMYIPPAHASEDDLYQSGYDHGCNDAGISDSSERYINQPGKGPSFHTGSFMRGYYEGFEACSDGIGDDNNAENNDMDVDGNLRVIATLDMVTYGNQYCGSRTFDMRVYIQSELIQEVCAFGNDLDLSGCRTDVNGPESEPERVTISIS